MEKKKIVSLAVAAAVLITCVGGLKLVDNYFADARTKIDTRPSALGDDKDLEDDKNLGDKEPNDSRVSEIGERLSFGNRILITNKGIPTSDSEFREAKSRGVSAMVQGDYKSAVSAFERAIKKYKNDPETLIYLNNARIGSSDAYTLAISVPIKEDSDKTDDRDDGADVALEMLRGMAQRQNEVNSKGGINGKPLKVIVADDDGDKVVAEQVAGALADNEDVLGVVGHFTSDASLAASDVYQSRGLVMISPTSTSVDLSTKGNYIFRSLTSDGFNAAALVNYMLNGLDLKKAAIFYNSDSSYSVSLMNVFKERLFVQDGRVVAEFDLFDDDFDALKSVKEAVDQGADTLVLFHNTGALPKGLEVVKANSERVPILSGDSGYKPEMLDLAEYTKGTIVVTVPWLLVGSEDTPFSKAALQLWAAEVSWRSAMTYDAAQALVTALNEADSRAEVQAAMSNPDFAANGVSGTIKFQENTGDRDSSPILVTVGESPDNPERYRFIPIKTTFD